MPRVREGRVRMQRGPQWLDDNGYRQFAWLTLDDGQLGRIWYRHGEWHYQPLEIHHAGERDPERSRRARRRFAPVFLFDGRTVPYRHWQAPGGSLLFVAEEDELLWSAFSGVAEDSLLHTRIDGNRVRLRCVTGASGLPIGWTYIPREDARPLLPGEHTGGARGAWDSLEASGGIGDCETRMRHACSANPCACPPSAVPCGFRVLKPFEDGSPAPATPCGSPPEAPDEPPSTPGRGPSNRHRGSVLRHLGAGARAALRQPEPAIVWDGATVTP